MKRQPDQVTTEEVKQWRGVHLLHYHMSSCSQKVRILMGELGIAFESHHIDLRRNEQKSDWYLGINPNGVVPVLVHDGAVHLESNHIIDYLNETFSSAEGSLQPADVESRARLERLLTLEDALHQDLRTVTFTYLAPALYAGAQTLSSVDRLPVIGRVHAAFAELDEHLEHAPYLLGDRLSLADIAWFITLHRLVLARYPLAEHAHLVAYYHRLAVRPAFREQVAAGPVVLRTAGAVYRTATRYFKASLARDFARWRGAQTSSAKALN